MAIAPTEHRGGTVPSSEPTKLDELHESEALPGARSTRLGALKVFDRVIDSVTALLLIAMVTLSIVQVFMRYVLGAPLAWPEEMSRWAFLWLVMLGCVTVTRTGSHIRMSMFVHLLPVRARPYTDLLGIALSAASLALIGYLGIGLLGETTGLSISGGVSYRWLYLALPVGAFLSLLNLLRSDVARVRRPAVYAAVVVGAALALVVLEGIQYSYLIVLDPTTVSLVASMLLLALGAPVAHALLLGAAVAFEAGGLPDVVVANHFASQVSTNFTMLAIPFFILMGALMNAGGITRAIIDLALSLVGHLRGGLGQVNIATSTLLGGLSGSSSADSAMVAKLLVPPMERAGYPRAFAAALTAMGSITTTMIPPSISFLLYASLAGVSVGALFMAGVVPGLIFAGALMTTVWLLAGRIYPGIRAEKRTPWSAKARALTFALPALLLPLGVLMLLRGGAVTATEAGAVACLFALVIGATVYRRSTLRSTWLAALESASDTAVILFLLAASGPLAWLLIAEQVPTTVARSLEAVDSQALLMVLIVVFLLVIGLVLEPPPAMVLVVPVLAPIAEMADINLIWLGVVLVLSIMLGQITPPVGGLIFIAAGVARAKVSSVYWEARWLYLPVAVVLALLVLVPALSLWLPRALGFQ
ncbi:TRAP transporter large permease subunit [Georgenia sp. EYE_87]|uniref:TRAP transporter large permease n=1 Tax=Georgenia sp. EYE_87 TaxID=2853448 RepID=UPI0020047747|nr:TRAP transporter large permease subunit [Georgenia sp. EYE_87]MCK6211483.1 TRAP transporter large permease subunit [Georgenia sp. EYE_87]